MPGIQNESLNFTETSWNDETMLKMLNLDDQPHNLEDEKSEDDPEDYVDENNTL